MERPSPVICGFMIVLGAIFGTLVTKPFPIVAKVLGGSVILVLIGAVCVFVWHDWKERELIDFFAPDHEEACLWRKYGI